MSRRRLLGGFGPTHILLIVALLEVTIDRVAVPLLRPDKGAPPTWHTVLDYSGLFLHYFVGTLALVLVLARCSKMFADRHGIRDLVALVALGAASLLAAVPLVIAPPAALSFPLEIAFAVAVIMVAVSGLGHGRDTGAQIGLVVVAVPLLVHTVNVVGAKFVWPEGAYDEPAMSVARAGVMALSLAALVSPYVFAPRPFARAVTRPLPVIIAMAIAAFGAIAARTWYPMIAKTAALAFGVELNQGQADPRLALYLLAVATLSWTLASCAIAGSEARRQIGQGIALVVLGGYAFRWPHHYMLPLFGLALIAEAGRRVRDEELAALPIASDTPPIADGAWSSYIGAVKAGLGRVLGEVHTVTTRGEGGLQTSLVVGDRGGIPVRTRIERIDGSVIALDIVAGRDIDEVRGATLSLWAIPPRTLGVNPNGPPAAPVFKSGDATFDQRFKARGSALAFQRLFDDGLRARAAATLDGWVAYWDREGLRYRVYPGRGAPLDHPLPLSDLALGRTANPDRLIAVIELLVEIASRGVTPPVAEPSALEALDPLDEAPADLPQASLPDKPDK